MFKSFFSSQKFEIKNALERLRTPRSALERHETLGTHYKAIERLVLEHYVTL